MKIVLTLEYAHIGYSLINTPQPTPHQFAHFFLRHLLGKFNSLTDLASLDPALYDNLMFLKHFDGDVTDLYLSFSIGGDEMAGRGEEIELVPGGSDIDVTNSNKMRYIYLVAHYRLNVALQRQSGAFLRGMRDLIPVTWLNMFSEPELQVRESIAVLVLVWRTIFTLEIGYVSPRAVPWYSYNPTPSH